MHIGLPILEGDVADGLLRRQSGRRPEVISQFPLYQGQPATIYNYGWMGMSPGAGTVPCQAAVVNAGTLEVGSGTLQLGCDSTIGGTCTVANNATLDLRGGTVNFV